MLNLGMGTHLAAGVVLEPMSKAAGGWGGGGVGR